MSFETLGNLLAEGNGWGQLIGPLLLFGFYIVATIFKAVSNRSGAAADDDDDDADVETASAVDTPRYKPIEQVSRPPQSRTLPYARTVEQAKQRSGTSAPRHEPADQQRDEWERQEDIKRRRAEQIEQLRRRQQLQRQQQQRLEQQQRQPQQQRPAPPPSARKAMTSVAVRQKSAKEAVRQARAGAAMHVGASRRDVLKQSAAKSSLLPALHGSRATSLRGLLNQQKSVRTAIVLSEILDKPLGLR